MARKVSGDTVQDDEDEESDADVEDEQCDGDVDLSPTSPAPLEHVPFSNPPSVLPNVVLPRLPPSFVILPPRLHCGLVSHTLFLPTSLPHLDLSLE